MKILFDTCVPRPLFRALVGHEVKRAQELGWGELRNGNLLTATENADFDVFITADQNLGYQQHLQGRRLAILLLPTNSWPLLRKMTDAIAQAVNDLRLGDYRELPSS